MIVSRKIKLSIPLFFMFVVASSILFAGGFDCGIWPGEGRPVFVAKQDLKIRKNYSVKSQFLSGKNINKGTTINYVETRIRTLTPGKLKVISPGTLKVRSFGDIEYLSFDDYYSKGTQKEIKVAAGDMLDYLQYRAEGNHFIRINNDVLEVEDFDKYFKVETQPQEEWWIGIELENKELGWVLISDENVEVSRRF